MFNNINKVAINSFIEKWGSNKHFGEKQDAHTFWLDLLGGVLGAIKPTDVIKFEKPIKITSEDKTNKNSNDTNTANLNKSAVTCKIDIDNNLCNGNGLDKDRNNHNNRNTNGDEIGETFNSNNSAKNNTSIGYIDCYIPETLTLIEQKGSDISLDKKERQSDGANKK